MLSRCFLDCSVGVWVFVTGLGQISSFFSHFMEIGRPDLNNILVNTSNWTLYIHNCIKGFWFFCLVALKPINQNFKLVWSWYAIFKHNFSTSNNQRCINFRFKIWTENSFMIACFRGNFQCCSKKFVCGKFLTRYKILLWYRFRQNEDGKSLTCDFFGLLPLKFILTRFFFSKKWLGEDYTVMLILDNFNIAYLC